MTGVRVNGFEPPFNPLQVTSWVVFGIDVCCFYIFFIPAMEKAEQIALGIIYLSIFAVVVSLCVYVTRVDPIDPMVLQEKKTPTTVTEANEDIHYCYLCSSHVGKQSKHCRLCDKCVHVFDHHCKWLNTCVGQINYKQFFGLISMVVVLTGYQLGIAIWLIATYGLDKDARQIKLDESYGSGFPAAAHTAVISVVAGINFPLFVMLCQLWSFHVFLISSHKTTYEYIIGKRQEKKAKEERVREEKEKRQKEEEDKRRQETEAKLAEVLRSTNDSRSFVARPSNVDIEMGQVTPSSSSEARPIDNDGCFSKHQRYTNEHGKPAPADKKQQHIELTTTSVLVSQSPPVAAAPRLDSIRQFSLPSSVTAQDVSEQHRVKQGSASYLRNVSGSASMQGNTSVAPVDMSEFTVLPIQDESPSPRLQSISGERRIKARASNARSVSSSTHSLESELSPRVNKLFVGLNTVPTPHTSVNADDLKKEIQKGGYV
eukprot:GILJ01002953.1.p1 GENE.GILJ01002953.1~~GILJ01002953.1.p1  ORF type:complete len:543 (+),score=93.68 GILJ01002953.1:173-1630(+)